MRDFRHVATAILVLICVVKGFYQVQFAQNLELTPSLQYFRDPASNPEEDRTWVLGMRLRLTS